MIEAQEKQLELAKNISLNKLSLNLLKLKNKIIANNPTINLNKLHIFTMDNITI